MQGDDDIAPGVLYTVLLLFKKNNILALKTVPVPHVTQLAS